MFLQDLNIVDVYTVKKIRGLFGKIPGIWLPILFALFLWAFTCRIFLEIKMWLGYVNRQSSKIPLLDCRAV